MITHANQNTTPPRKPKRASHTERAYLLKVLGGPLEVEGMTAQDVLVLRGKVEGL